MTRLTTEQAARRLGIKPATLYAYVSRGIVESTPSRDGRQRTFSATDIEDLAKRGRPRQSSRSHSLDFTIDTAVTSITQPHLAYRAHDAIELASSATYEQVAGLLMEGEINPHREWPAREVTVDSCFCPLGRKVTPPASNVGLRALWHAASLTVRLCPIGATRC